MTRTTAVSWRVANRCEDHTSIQQDFKGQFGLLQRPQCSSRCRRPISDHCTNNKPNESQIYKIRCEKASLRFSLKKLNSQKSKFSTEEKLTSILEEIPTWCAKKIKMTFCKRKKAVYKKNTMCFSTALEWLANTLKWQTTIESSKLRKGSQIVLWSCFSRYVKKMDRTLNNRV